MLVVTGLVAGLLTGLQATRLLLWGALHLSVGALAAFGLNALFGVLGAWGLRSRDAALAPGAGWFIGVLLLMFLPRPGGDVIVPESGGASLALLVLGFAGIAVAAWASGRVVPPSRSSATPRRASRR